MITPATERILTDYIANQRLLRKMDEKINDLQTQRTNIKHLIDGAVVKLESECPVFECPFGVQFGDQHVVVTHDQKSDLFNIETIVFHTLEERIDPS